MNKEKRQKLVDFISKSFADAPYPENGYVGFELEDFEGLHWKDVTPELLCTYVDWILDNRKMTE